MADLIHGETVKVLARLGKSSEDDFRHPTYTEVEITVNDVLVVPGPRSDLTESNRPDGKVIKYTLHFPKTYTSPLEGVRVNVRGEWFRVVGAPDHYTPENTPGKWSMPVEVEAVDG
jgi:hypothetical protein